MTATVHDIRDARAKRARKHLMPLVLSTGYGEPDFDPSLVIDLLVSLLESPTAKQIERWQALREHCGLSADGAMHTLSQLGYASSGDNTQPCAWPKCKRRVGPKRFAARVHDRLYCSTACASMHADERTATHS